MFYERQLVQKLLAANKNVSAIYGRFISRVSPILQQYRYNFRGAVIRDPGLEKLIGSELSKFKDELHQYIEMEKTGAWNMATDKTSDIINRWANSTSAATIAQRGLTARNIQAMDAFMKRKVAGMNLSDRVWQLAGNTKDQLEYYLQSGLAAGQSANKISQDVRQVLNEPDKRFRRVRDAAGKLVPSKPMEQYHPGRGVYRSSYQNARRLARTEINMAYRQSDMESWRELDMVLGYEVKLSNAHSIFDICDHAKGRYPKEFTFTGWHPACLCHAVPILMPPDQFDAWIAGEPVTAQYINDVPQGMKDWLTTNKQQIEGWKTKPYFMQQNTAFVDKIYNRKPILQPKFVGQVEGVPLPVAPVEKAIIEDAIPNELRSGGSYTSGTDIKFNNDFFALIDTGRPVGLKISRTGNKTCYNPGTKTVNIQQYDRISKSPWEKESVIYHEYGHAIDWQRGLRMSDEIRELMNGINKKLLKKEKAKLWSRDYSNYRKLSYKKTEVLTSKYGIIDAKLKDLNTKFYKMSPDIFKKYGISKYDVLEQINSTADALMSLNYNYGWGHGKGYMKSPGMRQAEFIAHCFENKFSGNVIFKKYMPEEYKLMIEYINTLK